MPNLINFQKRLILLVSILIAFLPQMLIHSQESSSPNPIKEIVWGSAGNRAVGYSLGTIDIINLAGQTIKTFNANNDLSSLAWNPDGTKLAYSNHFGGVWIWNSTNDVTTNILQDDAFTDVVRWSSSGTLLGIGSRNGNGLGANSQIQIWDAALPQLIQHVYTQISEFEINSMTWNPIDNNLVAVGSASGELGVWNIQNGDLQNFFTIEQNYLLTTVEWSKNGSKLAAGSTNGTVWIWNTSTWQPTVISLGVTPFDIDWNSSELLAIVDSSSVRVVDPASQAVIQTSPTSLTLTTVAWSPDGTQIILGSLEGQSQIITATQIPTPTPSSNGDV